ncbi:MAG: two-component system sensor histidine kinase NtrB [Planctomycetota bacterium]|jgi:PAS domain S-box-containing protein
MQIGLLTLDRRGKVALFNTTAEHILGYRAREVRGKPCEEIFTGLTSLLAGLGGKRPRNKPEIQLKTNARHKDGRIIPLLTTPYVIPGNGSPVSLDRFILVFQDALELEKMENHLRHLDRLQSLDEFAAGIVHEIRNPLAGISTNAQYMMEKMRRSDPFHEEMRDILADVKSIEGVVCKVLDFAHPNKSLVREAPIENVMEDVLRLSKMTLRRQGIRLQTNYNEPRITVKMDASQMKQVFFNIVRNACDAMPKGGELRVSTAHVPASNGHVRVAVEDTGSGIAEEHLDRIFDPFFSTHHEGMGLGLAISQKIVERHGGEIDVKSKSGKGAKFAVILPIV